MKTAEFETMSAQEQLSALHDGQLSADMAAALVRQSLEGDSLMQQWRSMSVIGTVMRQQQAVAVIDPSIAAQGAAMQSMPMSMTVQRAEAANDSVWRWKMVAGFAAFAAVGSLAWGLLGNVGATDQLAALKQTQALPADNGQVANVSTQGLILVNGQAAGQEIVMIRDPRLDELMAAHKQFGGNSALNQSAGSLRSVSIGNGSPSGARP